MEHKFYKEQGVLKCYVYSIKNSAIEEKLKQKEKQERLGLLNKFEEGEDEDKIYGEPQQIIIDLNSLGGITFFAPNKTELYQEGNFVDGVHVEFQDETDFVFLISFDEFEKIYFEYKGINAT